MKIIGIDFGMRRIGIAVSSGMLAQPVTVVTVRDRTDSLQKVVDLLRKEQAGNVVLGLPDGSLRSVVERFGREIERRTNIPVILWDETLSSQTATTLLVESGRGKKERDHRHDAVAAAVILQSFLDAQR